MQWVKAQDPMQLFELLWVALIPVPEAGADRSEVAWSGSPQELWSFAEVVLQRSLRSHAPPSAA